MAIQVEATPNPNSRKFVVGRTVAASTKWYGTADQAAGDELASAIFAISGVANVMLLNDFVTVGKDAAADWDAIEPAVIAVLDA